MTQIQLSYLPFQEESNRMCLLLTVQNHSVISLQIIWGNRGNSCHSNLLTAPAPLTLAAGVGPSHSVLLPGVIRAGTALSVCGNTRAHQDVGVVAVGAELPTNRTTIQGAQILALGPQKLHNRLGHTETPWMYTEKRPREDTMRRQSSVRQRSQKKTNLQTP